MSTVSTEVIKVEKMHKRYGQVKAVNGISFHVKKGEVFGLLGPNGAGKTTTLEILEGLQRASAGRVSVLGLNPDRNAKAVKERIGIQLQSATYYQELKLIEILDLFASFYKKSVNPLVLLERVALLEKAFVRVRQLSGGQQQRFSIAASLINDPQIVFLDEPTTGLDPQARRNLWTFIESLRADGLTVVLTTHYMQEAEILADRVGIIDAGKIIAMGTPRELIRNIQRGGQISFKAVGNQDTSFISSLETIPGISKIAKDQQGICRISTEQEVAVLPEIITRAEISGLELQDLKVEPVNLEDVFLELTGKKLRD